VINVKSGGRGRLSVFVAGAFLMTLILLFNGLLIQIPMAVLVGIMFMVCISTFDWSSIKNIRKTPVTDTIVMLSTVVTVFFTNDLSKGVLVGIILSALFFAAKISKVKVTSLASENARVKVYRVSGQLFFASVTDFVDGFNYKEDVEVVKLNLSNAHIWDNSGVGAIDKIVEKYRQNGVKVEVVGLNDESNKLVDKLAEYNKPGGLGDVAGH
jgi:MFS superfamily sulfate permease-like transporter